MFDSKEFERQLVRTRWLSRIRIALIVVFYLVYVLYFVVSIFKSIPEGVPFCLIGVGLSGIALEAMRESGNALITGRGDVDELTPKELVSYKRVFVASIAILAGTTALALILWFLIPYTPFVS